MFAMPQINGYLRAICVATEIALRAAELAESAFAAFAEIPYHDRHWRRELECLLNDMQGEP
jgi:hypothetical protein